MKTPLAEADLQFMIDLLAMRLGTRLEKDKEYLIKSRLEKIAEKEGKTDVGQLISYLRLHPHSQAAHDAVEAMTTNETYFFRDATPFVVLKEKVFPFFQDNRSKNKSLNIWSAASSTGQEAYSIAITIREWFPQFRDWNIQIIGTDVNAKVVARAREGVYSFTEISRGLTPEMLKKYFLKEKDEWRVSDDIRKMVKLWPMNLCQDWHALPKMEIIFLRNVLIYMDDENKKSILSRMHKTLQPDGFLFLGAAETTFNLSNLFQRMDIPMSGCFKRS